MGCIRDAYDGLIEKLKAIHGSADKPTPDKIEQKPDVSAKFEAFFADRRAKRNANT